MSELTGIDTDWLKTLPGYDPNATLATRTREIATIVRKDFSKVLADYLGVIAIGCEHQEKELTALRAEVATLKDLLREIHANAWPCTEEHTCGGLMHVPRFWTDQIPTLAGPEGT